MERDETNERPDKASGTASDEQNKRPLFRLSVEARIVMEVLEEAQIGEIVTYEELSLACGRDVVANRHLLDTARRGLLREQRKVFGAVLKVGLKRLDADETVGEAERYHRRSRSANRSAIKRLDAIEFSDLSGDKRDEYTALQSLARVVELTQRTRNQREIESLAHGKERALPVGDVVEHLFRRPRRGKGSA